MFTFADLWTAAGSVAAATAITLLIDVLKVAIPPITKLPGLTLAFILSAVLYVFGGIVVGIADPNQALSLFLAWLACAASAVGLHETVLAPVSQGIKKIGSTTTEGG